MELSNEQYRQMVNWMDRQQCRVAELEAENRELRHQLDDLRRGVGVSLVIQGRALPVSVLPAPEPTGPIATERPSYPVYSAPLQAQTPQAGRVSPATPPTAFTPRPMPAPDSTWLTGQMRAVRAPAPAAGASQPSRQTIPSQNMTPTWLREESALPAPIVPSAPAVPSWPSTPLSASRPRTLASATGKQPAARSPLQLEAQATVPISPARPRRPTVPRLEPQYLPSLGQLTGRFPAVRLPDKPAGERSPYSDSFVLG